MTDNDPNNSPKPDSTSPASSEHPTGTGSDPGTEPSVTLTQEQLAAAIQGAVDSALQAAESRRPQPSTTDASPPPTPPPEDNPFAGISDTDLVEGHTLKRLGENVTQRMQAMTGGMQQLYNQNLSALEMNARLMNKEVWDKYGDEIKAEVEKRKQYKVIDFGDFDEATALVQGRHLDEKASARAQQMMESTPPGDLGGTGTPVGQSGAPPGPELSEDWKKLLVMNWGSVEGGLRDVQAMLAYRLKEYGYAPTLEQYLDQMAKDQVIVDHKGRIHSEDLTPTEAELIERDRKRNA